MLVTLNDSNLQDAQALPVRQAQKIVTIANAVAITDTTTKTYNLITHGGLTENEIRQYRKFKISLNNSHDQTGNVSLYTAVKSFSPTGVSGSGLLYTEANVLTASTGRMILQDRAGGTGVATQIKAIPALEGVHSNLILTVTFSVAPTTGSLTILVEMN